MVPEFDELITRVTAVVNGIASVFPVDAQGWWAMERPTSPGSQSFTTRAFTGGQLAALRTALNNVSAHIVLS